MKKPGKIIWMLNLFIIFLFVISWLILRTEDRESGLTFAQLYFDKEVSGFVGEIPNSLLGLMKRNPEARDFVLNYPEYQKEKEEKSDLRLESKESDMTLEDMGTDLTTEDGMIPLFLQWDVLWGYEYYGDDFLAINGCGPTCLAMVCCGLSQNTKWNPYEVAKFAEDNGYYVNGAGSSWELMSEGAEEIGLTVHQISYDAAHIVEALLEGKPIICAMRSGDFTTSGHFIVLSGVNDAGEILVRDPNSIINSEKSWNIDRLIPQIKNLWGYSCGG